MKTFAFEIDATPTVTVQGSERVFPARRVFCVGRNYDAHAREMGAAEREPPFFFTKFASSVVPTGSTLRYPPGTSNYHYEGELVVAIGREGSTVPASRAHELIFGYAAGLDMTRRDLQLAARDKGRPWDTGKNFPQSAPIGPIRPIAAGPLQSARLELKVNGAVRQTADIADMIWSVPEIIEQLSSLYVLEPGDLIFTGTPAGVGAVAAGDEIVLDIEGLERLEVAVTA